MKYYQYAKANVKLKIFEKCKLDENTQNKERVNLKILLESIKLFCDIEYSELIIIYQ